MRMSCNGCRVLRKGCSDNCEIRPCIEWINSPDSQANATLFLAKFYGRAGLLNLINAGSQHLRPAIFKSLLYDACGRIVNPTYGSVGLLGSGNWAKCQAAVDAVLAGSPITGADLAALHPNTSPLKSVCDIRHVWRGDSTSQHHQHHELNLQVKSRNRFKRPATTACRPKMPLDSLLTELCPSPLGNGGSSSGDQEKSMFSVETVEVEGFSSLATRAEPVHDKQAHDHDEEIRLELTLGLAPI